MVIEMGRAHRRDTGHHLDMNHINASARAAQDAARKRDGKFGTQHLDEVTGVELESAADDRTQATIDEIQSMISDRTFDDFDAVMAAQFPGLAGEIESNNGFNNQVIHPIYDAVFHGDNEEAARLIARTHELSDRELTALASGWEPGRAWLVKEDSMYGDRVDGEFYDPQRPLSEVSKRIRGDIKGAVAAGYLPDEYVYRVTTSRGSVRIVVEGMPDDEAFYRDPNSPYAGPDGFVTVASWRRNQIDKRLQRIGDSYASMQSNSQVDYFNNSHYTSVTFESESSMLFWAHEKELAKLKKQIKAAPESEKADLIQAMKSRNAEMNREREAKHAFDREKWDW